MRINDDWIESYVEFTQDSESPEIYKRWAAVSTISAALKRKCFLPWHTTIYPNMYVVLVGPSGGRKSTAIGPAKSLLNELGIRITAESITREALIREMRDASESSMIGDRATTHSSLTVFASELAVFLGYGNPALLSDLCDFFDCENVWRYRTKTQGEDIIEGVYLNLLGCITPKLLTTSLPQDAVGGGLISRMVFIYAEGRGKKVALPSFEIDEHARSALLHDLEDIHIGMKGRFTVTQGFKDLYEHWYNNEDRTLIVCPQLEAYTERRATHLLKLCCVMSASRNSYMTVTEEDFLAAKKTLYEAESCMNKTFSGYGRSDVADILPVIMKEIANKKEVSFADLYRRHITDLSLMQMEDILKSLESIRYCRVEFRNNTRVIVLNPEALTAHD